MKQQIVSIFEKVVELLPVILLGGFVAFFGFGERISRA